MSKRKPTPDPPKKRASGPSGATQTAAARRAAGRTRIEAWLPTALVARLDAYRGELSRREALEAGVTLLLRAALDGGKADG